jgi:hypothetical protein
MADRGVIYMVWGQSENLERALQRSRDSLAIVHPELPIEVIRVNASDPVEGLLQKAKMQELTPFKETLFLDVDTVVLDRLDFGFRQAQRFGLACCINENPWARRNVVLEGDTVEYNTGVLFFTERAQSVFGAWKELAAQLDSTLIHFVNGMQDKMAYNDQCSFAVAVDQASFSPFVLALNWNFRPIWHRSFFGPIKIWHDYAEVPPFFYDLAKHYRRKDAIIQYHAASG